MPAARAASTPDGLSSTTTQRAGSAHAVGANLLDTEALPGLVAAALERYGRLDVLVNNASSFYPTPVGEITAVQFDDFIGTNLRAPLFLAQAAAPALRAPTFHEQGDDVLLELGLDWDALIDLKVRGIVA